jgi:maleamate amidohydrolase
MSDLDVYEAQGFGRRMALGHRPALLVVDFVNGFIDPAIFGGGNIGQAAERTRELVRLWRSRSATIAFTRIVYAEDGSDAGVWCEKVPGLRQLTEHASASQIVEFLAPTTGDLIIRKRQASAFFETELASALRYRSIDTVVIAGCTTSGCVRASVVDAIGHNFRPVVVSDCVGDRAIGPHEANLFDLQQKYADLISAQEADKLFGSRS